MKRALIVVGLVATAGAGAYGQSIIQGEAPSRDAIQVGVVYEASFCGGTGSFGVRFEMKVTKLLNDKWFEADYGSLNKETGEFYGDVPNKARFNQVQLCYVKPIVP